MKKAVFTWAIVLWGLLIGTSAGVLAYKHHIKGEDNSAFVEDSLYVKADKSNVINENTVLSFVSIYDDGFRDTREIIAPAYMKGWNRDKMALAYSSWQMDEFSKERVVFNKYQEGRSSQHYFLGEKEGYVAVYYKDSGILKEITSTPAGSLSDEEKKILKSQKEINGDEHLYRYLQDLES